MIFAGRHVVVGASGSGKSTTAEWILARILAERRRARRRTKAVVFDCYGEIRPKGSTYVNERRELARAVLDGRYPIVSLGKWPDLSPLDHVRDLSLLLDEAWRFMGPSSCHESLEAIFCGGRHLDQDWIVATQYPAQLHPSVLANCNHAWIHPLQHHEHVRAIERGLSITLKGRTWKPAPGRPEGSAATVPLHWARAGAHDFLAAAAAEV